VRARVRCRPDAGGRPGKSGRPVRGEQPPLSRTITGDEADRAVDEARRRTTTRRELSTHDGFAQISPEVGVLDHAAIDAGLEHDPDTTLTMLAELTGATDARLRDEARRVARDVMIDLVRDRPRHGSGIGRIVTRAFRSPGDDVDLDHSSDVLLDAVVSRTPVNTDDLSVRAWTRRPTAWCLLVDRSGSMHGRPLATAALAAAAVAMRAERGDYAVLAFARDVVAAKSMWEVRTAGDVVDRVLALRGHGTTDLAAALTAAAEQFASAPAARAVTVLLSDCRATEPGDAIAAAARLDELVVLAPRGDDRDARALAEAVGARWATYQGPSTVAAALTSVLSRT
jgi:Mg-chelatase subunit ChlD